MFHLTRQEQWIVAFIMAALILGCYLRLQKIDPRSGQAPQNTESTPAGN